jgi:O-antigen/teichoic acid export membrane protein
MWARDSSVVLASQFSALAVTSLLTILVARELGPSGFGVLAGLLGLAQLLTVLVDAGISTYLLRELSAAFADDGTAGRFRASELLSSALSTTTAAAALMILGSALVSVAAFLHDLRLAFVLSSLVGYTTILACADGLEVAYRAQRRLRLLSTAIFLEKGTLATLVGAAVWTHAGLSAIAAAYLVAGCVRLSFDLARVRDMGLLRWQAPTRRGVFGVLRASLPFGLSSTTPTAIVRLDTTLVALLSTAAAGSYAVGDRVLTTLLVLSSTAAATLYPLLARHRDSATIRRAAALMFVIGVILAAPAIILAPWAIPGLFGGGFRDAVEPVQLMLLATPMIYASSVLMTGLFSLGRERLVLTLMLTCTLSGTLLVVLGQLLVGVNGAASGYTLRFVGMLAALLIASSLTERASPGETSDPETRQHAGDAMKRRAARSRLT